MLPRKSVKKSVHTTIGERMHEQCAQDVGGHGNRIRTGGGAASELRGVAGTLRDDVGLAARRR